MRATTVVTVGKYHQGQLQFYTRYSDGSKPNTTTVGGALEVSARLTFVPVYDSLGVYGFDSTSVHITSESLFINVGMGWLLVLSPMHIEMLL